MKSLLALLFLAATALAQQQPAAQPGTAGNPAPGSNIDAVIPIFRANLPGGTYTVAVRAILAVSQHEYIVDGVARVTEVNIDTNGSLVARFYAIEPAATSGPSGIGAATIGTAQKLLTTAAEKVTGDAWRKVQKSYPVTTHARTVEYRVEDKEQLTRIFTAADEALRLQKARVVSVASE